MPEHEIHHRGQLYTMLGMLDVQTPPLYGMTRDERDRSALERPEVAYPARPKTWRAFEPALSYSQVIRTCALPVSMSMFRSPTSFSTSRSPRRRASRSRGRGRARAAARCTFSPASRRDERAEPHAALDDGDRHADVHVLLAVAVLGRFVDVDAHPPRASARRRRPLAASARRRRRRATARNNRSASSTVIFPCANRSSTRRVSSLMIVLCFPELAEHIVRRSSRRARGARAVRWSTTARRRRIGRLDFGEGQQRADPVQPVLDRGVADAEELLHLLDGAVAADERGDEDLVFGGEAARAAAGRTAPRWRCPGQPAARARSRTARRR